MTAVGHSRRFNVRDMSVVPSMAAAARDDRDPLRKVQGKSRKMGTAGNESRDYDADSIKSTLRKYAFEQNGRWPVFAT